jgi:DNA-binding transcriptional LysR family regulator
VLQPLDLPPFTFQQLRIFVGVARELSVTRAASALGISQPAASQAVRELERRLDTTLFEREKNRLRLTYHGDLFFGPALQMLEEASRVGHALTQPKGRLAGELNFGASTTIGNYIMPEPLQRFRQAQPDVRIRMTIAHTATVVDRVLARDLPLGLVEGRVHHPDLVATPYAQDQLVVVCRPDHAWASRGEATGQEVVDAPFIARERGSGTRVIIEDRFRSAGFYLTSMVELGNTESIKDAVMRGLGISIMSSKAVVREVDAGLLSTLLLTDVPLTRSFQTVRRTDRRLSPVLETFLNLLA